MVIRDTSRQSRTVPEEMQSQKDHLRVIARATNALIKHAALHPTDVPTTATATYTMVDSDHLIPCNATGAPFPVFLITAAGREGRRLVVKKLDASANAITVDPKDAETIDGAASVTLTTQYETVELVSNGTNWEEICCGSTSGASASGSFLASALTSAHIFVGNGSNVATDVAVTGDVTITSAGVTAIGAGKVTEAMQVLADNTTQDVSTTKHGYVPKAPNDTTKFLRGDATWATATSSTASAKGALVYLGSNLAAITGSDAATIFDTSSYNDSVQPADAGGTQRFWLGASKTMTVASTSAGVETLTITGHGLTTGEGPILFTNSGGGLPGGISAGTKYWAIVVDANTIALATSRANALANTRVDITSSGTGTHTLASGAKLVIPSTITRAQLFGSMTDNGSGINVNISICKNGVITAYPGRGRQDNGSAGTQGSVVATGPIEVAEGDYFELWNLAGSADTLIAENTWFAIHVVTTSSSVSTYTDEEAQDAVGGILTDTATIDFTYTDGGPTIEASVRAASITEAMQVLADNTTNNVSTTKHGYAPKAPNDATKFLDGTGAYAVPAGPEIAQILVTDPNGAAIATGDGQAYLRINSLLNGRNLTAVAASVTTVSSSGIPTIQIHNVTQAADMLTTKLTIDANESDSKDAATPAVIDAANDDVATGDQLRIDVDVAGTGAKGLIVEMTFTVP